MAKIGPDFTDACFQAVAAVTPEAFVTIDGSGKILFFNPAATAIFGYAPEEVVGKDVAKLMPARFVPARRFEEF